MPEKGKAAGKSLLPGKIGGENIPFHIAIIMDGNGRWARKRGLPRIAGHKRGMDTLIKIVTCAHALGIGALSLYAFSTENWKRPALEVDFLMRLPEEYLRKELDRLMEKDIRILAAGELGQLPSRTQLAIEEALIKTGKNKGMILNFAVNYGGRSEIIRAIKDILLLVRKGQYREEDISEDLLAKHLYTANLPDPDLLIRPSGEVRVSNFMLWQLAYTELWFTDTLWPDFTEEHFLQAIRDYQARDRRFGNIQTKA
ncbi:MAG TPA: isoprenyl transferase [Firmicutes bacterium]|jgi:undecaprenyl diphosphate synthase|nr:isoprenyl transferase [Bacillota bacterium]